MILNNVLVVGDNDHAGAYSMPAAQDLHIATAGETSTSEDLLSAAVEAANNDTTTHHVDEETLRLMQLLEGSLIDPSESIEATDYMFRWGGVDFMPRQNIVSLKAPAKTGKTFALTAFATTFLNGTFGGIGGYASSTESILFVDTEQARNSSRKVLRRILKQAPAGGSRIKMLNVRKCEAKERLPMIALAVELYNPTLIIIDGIADLIPGMDYNNQEYADAIITKLCAMAEGRNAVVLTAIHTNKGNATEASGWLGRLLLQKCALEIGLTRKAGSNTRTMEFVTRDREIEPITVAIEETDDKLGQIRIVSPAEAAEAKADMQRSTYKTKLQELGIEPPMQMPRPEWVRLIVERKTTDTQHPYTRNNAEKFIKRCIEAGALSQRGDSLCFTA